MSARKTNLVVGILGGIGSGKSAVSNGLSTYFQTYIIDADRIGHEVLGISTVKDSIRRIFGDDVFDRDGICRRSLARQVFGAEIHHQQALKKLEEIVHPQIRRIAEQQISEVPDGTEIVLLDAAVMLEAGWDDLCDYIVFVDVPFEIRLARVQENRGWTADELRRREASQISVDQKRNASEFVVDNSKSLDDAVRQLVSFIQTKLPTDLTR